MTELERASDLHWLEIVSRLLVATLCLCVVGCGKRQKWSAEERANIEHYRHSNEANNDAVRILNAGSAFSRVTPAEQARISDLQKTALAEAKEVRDDVLAKVHPDLPRHYRSEYQKSLELDIESWESGQLQETVEATTLHDKWVDWHNANKEGFHFPAASYGRGFGRFFLTSLLASVVFPFVYSFLILPVVGVAIATLVLKGEEGLNQRPPVALLVVGFVVVAYVLCGWAAFVSGLARYFAANPAVIHAWLYYLTGFFFCMSPLGYMASKERDAESLLTCLHTGVVAIAFVTFSIWPVLARWLYGWFLAWFF